MAECRGKLAEIILQRGRWLHRLVRPHLRHQWQLQFSGELLQRRDIVDLFFLLRLCFCVVTLKAKLNPRYRLSSRRHRRQRHAAD
jgi:hypothetical protein